MSRRLAAFERAVYMTIASAWTTAIVCAIASDRRIDIGTAFVPPGVITLMALGVAWPASAEAIVRWRARCRVRRDYPTARVVTTK